MQIKEMVEYQKLDGQIRRLENDLKNSEERKNAAKMQDYLRDSQNKLAKLEESSDKLVKLYKKAHAAYNDFMDKLDKLVKEGLGENPGEVTARLEKANAFSQAAAKLEKDLESLNASIAKVNSDFDAIMKNSKTAKANFEVYKTRFNELKAKKEPEINELKSRQNKLSLSIDAELLARYKQKVESKYPVFVPEADGRCGGCRMEISGAKLKSLKEKGVIECENCGRYIYQS